MTCRADNPASLSGALTQALGFMFRISAILVLSLLAAGCAASRTSAGQLGVNVGDRLVLLAEATAVTCQAWQSTASMWFSAPPDARCLEASSEGGNSGQTIFPAGSQATVVGIKHLNTFESEQFLIYVAPAGTKEHLIVKDYAFSRLLRVARANEP